MNGYKVLNKQSFQRGNYSIVPLRSEDRYDIVQWRNEQIYHLRQATPLTKEAQDTYFDTIVASLFTQEQPNQILFSYLENNKCIGYGGLVHINWMDRNAEISFIMNTELEAKHFEKHWYNYLYLIEKVAFAELNLHKIYTYAFDVRPHLYKAVEKAGFLKDAVLKEHCLFNGEFENVIIHSKIQRPHLTIRSVSKDDIQLLFEWANEKQVRENAIETDAITYPTHEKWFQNKLTSDSSLIYICSLKSTAIGQVRFDKIDNDYFIDYSLDYHFRGRRLGLELVKLAIKKLRKSLTIDKISIKAIVKDDNFASLNIFREQSFSENRLSDNLLIFHKTL